MDSFADWHDTFFDTLNLPQLIETSRDSLGSELSQTELQEAIKSFPSGKAAGHDGFGALQQFYKALIATLMLRMLNDSFNNKKLRVSLGLYEADVCCIRKVKIWLTLALQAYGNKPAIGNQFWLFWYNKYD